MNHSRTWDHGIIPYRISNSVPDSVRVPLHFAMLKVENMSCVRFLPRTSETDYIFIEYGDRCCSHQGKVGTGPHWLYVSDKEICLNRNESIADTVKKLTYHVTHDHCKTYCGTSFIMVPGSSPGTIRSPGDTQYPPNAECVWRFWIPPHANRKTLKLTFSSIHLEGGDSCSFDYIQIFQEDSKHQLLIENSRLCGQYTHHQINVSNDTNVVSVHFRSDSSTEMDGFVLNYSLTNDTVLCSVQNGGCSQLCLSNSNGEKIGCSCRPGYSLSTDGSSCNDINECSLNGSLCEQKCQNTEGSYYCYCRQGFGITSDMRSCEVCGGTLDPVNGSISSPGYPKPYPPQQNCKWTLYKIQNHFIIINITQINISRSLNCSNDYIRATHGHFPNKRICGQYSSIQYILHTVGIKTTFRFYSGPLSSSSGSHSGFLLTYQQVPSSEIPNSVTKTVYINGQELNYDTKPWIQ